MDITGRIIMALPEVSGVSKAGNNWHKREYVLETLETYPKKVHFDFFGERADQYPLNVGDVIKLYYDIESREYQGRWYTSIRGWKAEAPETPAAAAPGAPAASAAAPGAPATPPAPTNFPPQAAPMGGDDGDLPF